MRVLEVVVVLVGLEICWVRLNDWRMFGYFFTIGSEGLS
jgi:hypothetical protein